MQAISTCGVRSLPFSPRRVGLKPQPHAISVKHLLTTSRGGDCLRTHHLLAAGSAVALLQALLLMLHSSRLTHHIPFSLRRSIPSLRTTPSPVRARVARVGSRSDILLPLRPVLDQPPRLVRRRGSLRGGRGNRRGTSARDAVENQVAVERSAPLACTAYTPVGFRWELGRARESALGGTLCSKQQCRQSARCCFCSSTLN